MILDLTAYALLGFLVTVLIPWACLETASFLHGASHGASIEQRRHAHEPWR